MYFFKSINIKKLKGMICVSSANAQDRLRKHYEQKSSFSFHPLSYKCSPEADRVASVSLSRPIWELTFVVLLGNLVLACNFFPTHHLLFTSVEDGGGSTSHRK